MGWAQAASATARPFCNDESQGKTRPDSFHLPMGHSLIHKKKRMSREARIVCWASLSSSTQSFPHTLLYYFLPCILPFVPNNGKRTPQNWLPSVEMYYFGNKSSDFFSQTLRVEWRCPTNSTLIQKDKKSSNPGKQVIHQLKQTKKAHNLSTKQSQTIFAASLEK